MKSKTEHLLEWLRDAHALEQQMEVLLKGQAERLEHYPDLKLRIESHLEQTIRHQQALNIAIQRMGGGISSIKDWAGKLMATGQNLVGTAMSDEVVKSAMTLYVFTHTAISSYSVLIAGAEAANNTELANTLKYMMEDEITMSNWLFGNLPLLTQSFLSRSEYSTDIAKR